jgi:hypothetical protein
MQLVEAGESSSGWSWRQAGYYANGSVAKWPAAAVRKWCRDGCDCAVTLLDAGAMVLDENHDLDVGGLRQSVRPHAGGPVEHDLAVIALTLS